MSFVRSKPQGLHLLDVLRMNKERGKRLLAFHEHVMCGPSAFTEAERALIFAYGSGLNASRFRDGGHNETAAAFGVDEGLYEKLLADLDEAPVDERMRPVLEFVRKLTLSPGEMTRADADAVYEAGWDERALLDAVSVCALQNYMDRLVDGMGVDEGAHDWGAAGQRLSTLSYAGAAAALFAD